MSVSRRSFLKRSAFAAGGLWAGRAAAAESAGHDMRYRTLGRTGLRVSEVGFGAYGIRKPDVIRYAVDRGVNYIDTSHCYRGGKSEDVVGKALKGIRDKVILTTKWCPYHIDQPAKKQVFIDMLDRSLQRLQTDYVDVLLNHQVGKESDGVGLDRLKNPEMYEAWETVKQAGKARFLGASGHNSDLMEIMNWAVDSDKLDVLLCRYSFLDYPEQQKLIDRCAEKNVGFIAMKTLAGAKGADLDNFRDKHTSFKQAALKWVLSNAKVSNLIISIQNSKQVDEYVAAAGADMQQADYDLLHEYADRFSEQVCRYCGDCAAACPDDVRIADILRFSMYEQDYGQEGRGSRAYASLVAAERAAHCQHCKGLCEQACGYDLPIRTLLLDAHKQLTSLRPGAVSYDPAAGAG